MGHDDLKMVKTIFKRYSRMLFPYYLRKKREKIQKNDIRGLYPYLLWVKIKPTENFVKKYHAAHVCGVLRWLKFMLK